MHYESFSVHFYDNLDKRRSRARQTAPRRKGNGMPTHPGLAATMSDPAPRPGRAMDVLRVASGNFIAMYDFMVFGYFAAAIGSAYFPGSSELGTLLKALATFGVGFLMRPLGA